MNPYLVYHMKKQIASALLKKQKIKTTAITYEKIMYTILSCRQPCNCKPVVFRMKIQKSDSDLTACYFCTNAYYEQLKQKPSAKIAPQTVFHQILFYIHSKSNGTGCTVNDII